MKLLHSLHSMLFISFIMYRNYTFKTRRHLNKSLNRPSTHCLKIAIPPLLTSVYEHSKK